MNENSVVTVYQGNTENQTENEDRSRDGYGSIVDAEIEEVPSDIYVSMSVIGMLAVIFLSLALFGITVLSGDTKQRNYFLVGLFSAYALAFFLSIILGGGLAFLEIPERLERFIPENISSVFRRDMLD